MDPKSMSLDDLIKKQKQHKGKSTFAGGQGGRGNKFGGGRAFRGGNRQSGGNVIPRERTDAGIFKRGGNQTERFRQGRGGRFQQDNRGGRGELRGGAPRIQRFRENAPVRGSGQQRQNKLFGPRGSNAEFRNERRINRRAVGGQPLRRKQGGLLQGGLANEPKQLNTLIPKPLRGGKKLKVRNLDEKQVSNDDLKRLFEKVGKLTECKFDRNEFGQFLGSATVVYEKREDAEKAIEEYHGAQLDDKVLTVEHDIQAFVRAEPRLKKVGKTLRVGGGRGAAAAGRR